MPRPLPTTTANFRDIIEGNYVYIDKTKYIYNLAQLPKGAWFLSRPRRFGKSLFIATMEEFFRGNRELFHGLWVDKSDYEWTEHAVIRLEFNLYPSVTAAELQHNIKRYLAMNAQRNNVQLEDGPYYAQFGDLILALAANKPVVILIDEYDKPLIDNLHNLPEAKAIQATLKGFYGVIKAMDRYIRMSFITGITKFSRVGVFSDLNNLTDLTLHSDFATAFGLTEAEIRRDLADYITPFAQREGSSEAALLDKMRHWYNGFCFAPDAQNVYNPYSTLLLFYNQRFSNYWFESGSPSFLIRLIHSSNFDLEELADLELSELAFSTFELDRLSIIPLLFQTGYLTIKEYFPERQGYRLGFPNYEVENAFMVYLLDAFSNTRQGLSDAHLRRLTAAIQTNDLDQFFKVLQVFFANIDYDLQLDHEKYYQTIFYLIFKLIGLRIDAEIKTNDGRIDAVIELENRIYLFEFKLNQSAQEALQQIEEREYYRKYQLHGKAITCIGANFDTSQRMVDDWLIREITQ